MTRLLASLVLVWATTSPVGADVFIGRTDNGSLILTNLPRAGQEYQRVVREGGGSRNRAAPVATQKMANRPFAEHVARAAADHDLPPALLHAVIRHESNYNPAALSPRGAAGLMQLMPATASDLGVADVWDPQANIAGGARYLKQLLTRFDEDVALALAAYNAGPGAVLSNGRTIPPYPETQRYVPSVMREYQRLQAFAP